MSNSSFNKDYPNYKTLQALYAKQLFPELIASLLPSELNIMRELFRRDQIHTKIRPARSTIAAKANCSTKTVTRGTNHLNATGLIEKKRKLGMPFDMCTYTLTSVARHNKPRILALGKMYQNMNRWVGLSIAIAITPSSAAGDTSVPPYKLKDNYLFIKTQPHLQPTPFCKKRVNEATNVRAHERIAPMEQITPELQKATNLLNLTKWGQIRLSAYPARALADANSAFRNSKSHKTEPFNWFMAVCNKWCQKNNIEPDWGLVGSQSIEHDMPDGAPMFNSKNERDLPFSVALKQASPNQGRLSTYIKSQLRKATQDRIAENRPEDILKERNYLLNHPEWLDMGIKLGVDMSRYGFEKPVTEPKSTLDFPSIDEQDEIWDRLEAVPVMYEGSQWEEI